MEKKTNNIFFGSYVKLIKGFSVANVFRGVLCNPRKSLKGPLSLLFINELFMCCTNSARVITTIQLDSAWALVQQ